MHALDVQIQACSLSEALCRVTVVCRFVTGDLSAHAGGQEGPTCLMISWSAAIGRSAELASGDPSQYLVASPRELPLLVAKVRR